MLPGSKIIIIDPVDRIIIHSVDIFDKDGARRAENYWREQEAARGRELERVIVSMAQVRIMGRNDPIPVPLPAI